MTRSVRGWFDFGLTRLGGCLVDVAALGFAYFAANLLRFDLQAPRWGWRVTALAFVTVGVVHLLALAVTGCYRLAWRRTRLADLPRYLAATVLACVVLTILRLFLAVDTYAHVRPPYSITLISFVLATCALVGWRIVWSWFWNANVSEYALLSRKLRTMDSACVRDFLQGKTVMITGAGGSIGSEIVRQVTAMQPKKVLLVERGENALYEINRECQGRGDILPLMKDINDVSAMETIFAEHRPEIVLHAAAYKHVPMVEMNPEEGWRNNTEATRHLAELAQKYGVSRFVLISTDKAVNPVSVMGKTKLAAEQAIMEVNGERVNGETTSFCAVRFGNVFGSSGSVVPLFRELIAKRLPITVTHPEMKRYFMTVEEAVGLVLQAASRKEKAIYTLDMGKPIKILDLAEGMIRQAGFRPYVDIPIVFTGIRPGEKLFEELDVSEKSCYKTDMARIYITKVKR